MKFNFVHWTGTEIIGALQCLKIPFDLLTDMKGTVLISALQCGRIFFELLTTGQGQNL